MYDRFTNLHKLNNIIWVWTTDTRGSATDWYPGDKYVDIVGMDIYTTPPEHSSQVLEFEKVKDITSAKKIIALSECGAIPSAANMIKDGAWWSWFMPWYHDYTLGYHNQEETWRELFGADHVVKVEDLPDWDTYILKVGLDTHRHSPAENSPVTINYLGQVLHIILPEQSGTCHAVLFTLSGKQVAVLSGSSRSVILYNTSPLRMGAYLLWIKTDAIEVSRKVVINR